MKKRIISILTVAALLLSLAACGKHDAGDMTDIKGEPNTTYTGTVSAISTQSITLTTDADEITITLTEVTAFSSEFGMGGQIPGNMGQIQDGMGEIPSDIGELPEGMGNTIGELHTGDEAQGSMETPLEGMGNAEPPEKPDGDISDQGGTPPELPEGDNNQSGITAMDPMTNQTQSATIAVVYIGASVTVVTDDNGSAATVTVSGGNMAGMQQPGNMGQMPGETIAGTDSNDATE